MNSLSNRKLLYRFIGRFFLCNAFLFWVFGYVYLKNTLSSDTLFDNLLFQQDTLGGKTTILLFALFNYLSYLMLLAFIPALFLILVTFFVPFSRFIRALSILVATISLLLLICDSFTYLLFKFHLNLSILRLIFSGEWYGLFDFSIYETSIFFAIFCIVCIVELIIARFVWSKIRVSKHYLRGRTIGGLWLGVFLISYFTLCLSIAESNNLYSQQTINLPLYNQLMGYLIPDKNAEEILYHFSDEHYSLPVFSKEQLKYPLHPMQCTKPQNPPNIILILVDSLRFDSVQHMPEVTRFGKGSWQFINHLSGGNGTQSGIFSLFYSLPNNYWTAAMEQNVPPVLIQLLLKYRYSIEVLWSSGLLNPPFNKTVFGRVKNLKNKGAPGYDTGNKDRYITNKAIEFLADKKQPFFITLFYDALHGYCRDQSFPTPYQPTIQRCFRIGVNNDEDPVPYYNRYLNAVNFVDGEIGKLLKVIEQNGYLKNSVVIISSDHGQEFNDSKQNYWGHASNYTRAQVHIPLIIHFPEQEPRVIQYETSSYDVAPTLLQRLYQCKNQIKDYSIGQNLLIEQPRLPFLLASGYSNMGIIEPDRLTTLRTSGNFVITDLQAKPNPEAKLRMDIFKQSIQLMRNYYKKHLA